MRRGLRTIAATDEAIICGAMAALTLMAAEDLSSAAATERTTDAIFFTGNDVHEFCQLSGPFAPGYTVGLWDATTRSAVILDGLHGLSKMTDVSVEAGLLLLGTFCPPSHVTIQKATDVFCKYLRDSPEKRHLTGAILFSQAMTNACPG